MKRTIILLILVLLVASLANALTIPHAFYGSVTNDGNPVADGVVVTAEINDVVIDTCKVKDGKYGYGEDTLIVESENSGDKITFYINGVKANEEFLFESSKVTELDLTVSGDIPEAPVCQESWSCTAWSSCSNDQQTRTCTDSNNCGTANSKPSEQQSCSSSSGSTDTGSSSGGGGSSISSSSSSGGGGNSGFIPFDDDEETTSGSSSSSKDIVYQSNLEGDNNLELFSDDKEQEGENSLDNGITGAVVGFFEDKPVPAYSGLALLAVILIALAYLWIRK